MTGNSNKVRAVFLAALMVFSVFAGTVAFSGSAAASAPSYDGNAVHYGNQSNDASGSPVIEVPMRGGAPTAVNNSSVTLLDDGDNISSEVVTDVRVRSFDSSILLTLNRTVPSDDLEVSLSDGLTDGNGNPIDNPGEKSVVFAGQTIEHDTGNDTVGQDSQENRPANITAYQGVTLAVNASNVSNPERRIASSAPFGINNVEVVVEGEDNNYFQEGGTGENSTVFTFDTEDRELGQYKIYLNGTDNPGNRTYVNVRDLGLDIEVDDTNVSTEDTIETDVSAVAGGRAIEAELLDSSGDTVATSDVNSLDNQGGADVDFDAATADGGNTLDTGTYTVQVTDNATGIVVESSEITVSEADDAEVSFTDNIATAERGDILEFTLELTETDFGTVSFGGADDGVIANATFEDDNDDGEVTFYLNTFELYSPGGGPGDDNAFYLDSDSDDNIVQQDEIETTDDLVDAGDYDIEAQATGEEPDLTADPVGDSDDVATVTLNERSNSEFRTWTAPDGTSVNDLEDINEAIADGEITQSSDISNGDIVVHQLVASGFEGALDAQQDEDVTTAFFNGLKSTSAGPGSASGIYNLTVEEASPGANQDAKNLTLNTSNTDVIADGPNDTYFVIFDTDGNVKYGDNTAVEDDTALEANFSVLSNDESDLDFVSEDEFDSDENEESFVEYDVVEPDITVSEPFNVSQASGQTVTGTTTLAPSTELTLRVRSQDGVSPSFLKTSSPVVQSDGTFSATFDFSQQSVGDEYEIIVQDPIRSEDETEDGQVVEAVATATPEPDTATPEPDTATPEPDTDTAMPDTDTPTSTPTSTPGFGVVVALTALLAAALLAIRRES